MIKLKLNNNEILRKHNVLSEEDRELVLKDVKYEIKHNLCNDADPYQTHANLLQRYQDKTYWNRLYSMARAMIDDNYMYYKSWANLSNEDNNYQFHQHENKMTCVYYLKSNLPEYGTKLEGDVILESTQNSMIAFDGMILHSVANMPKNIAKDNPRYSIVFKFKLSQ